MRPHRGKRSAVPPAHAKARLRLKHTRTHTQMDDTQPTTTFLKLRPMGGVPPQIFLFT